MWLNNAVSFTRTIRFRLTLLYSSILFLISTALVLSLNIYLDQYLKTDPTFVRLSSQTIDRIQPSFIDDFTALRIDERLHIREIRLNDLKQIQKLSLLSLAPVALISFAMGYAITGRFLKPLSQLKDEINDLNTKDLGKVIPVEINDEVGQLIQSFNDLSSRLKEGFQSQELFVQDASHELKTPLTIMQTNLDTILDDPKASKEELRQAIENALGGMKSLRELTNNLLELSTTSTTERKNINLAEVITQQVYALKEVAKANKVTVKTEFSAQIPFKGDEIAIGRAFFNLIENAVKYSKTVQNPQVTITSKSEKKSISIFITDNGLGISQKDIGKVFSRFYRVDSSRNKQESGFGLGLAITKKTIEAHKGKISVTSKPGETVFAVRLPLR